MFEDALPWWAEHGLDRAHGGAVEQFTLDGRDAAIPFKRTRVACRQLYVFSHASILGFHGGEALAKASFDWLTERAWQGDDRGFARRTTREGAVLDATPDLYDIAFCLFAFAWRFRATGEPVAKAWLHRTLDFVEGHMRHPAGGFRHELPGKGHRQQNPHMHLTEAMLAAYEATGEQRFADIAREIVGLFRSKFFDLKTGTLAEYFTEDLARAPGEDGQITEPGHMMEWTWILGAARRLLDVDTSAEMQAASAFAERHGVDPTSGAVYNTIRDDGAPIDRASRCWPNTERIKMAVALHELDGRDTRTLIDGSASVLLSRYLAHEPRGTWIDVFDAEGRPESETIPASTLYHVFLAFAEALRVSG
jgi:N-acylglucosamine 2-epimerase/mannose-6-phosphate isomerase